jgi:hypothetical protein
VTSFQLLIKAKDSTVVVAIMLLPSGTNRRGKAIFITGILGNSEESGISLANLMSSDYHAPTKICETVRKNCITQF